MVAAAAADDDVDVVFILMLLLLLLLSFLDLCCRNKSPYIFIIVYHLCDMRLLLHKLILYVASDRPTDRQTWLKHKF